MIKRFPLLASIVGLALLPQLPGCGGNGTITQNELIDPADTDFQRVDPLTAADVNNLIEAAASAIDGPTLSVAVVDRTGFIVGAYSRVAANAADIRDEDNIAVSLARTTAFFSNSQAPLSSRTVETLAQFHFPPTFENVFVPSVQPATNAASPIFDAFNFDPAFPQTVIAPTRNVTGIAGTPQGALWQINATNRGAPVAAAPSDADGLTIVPTRYNNNLVDAGLAVQDGQAFPRSTNIQGHPFQGGNPYSVNDPNFPSPGITLLPGAIPLFKADQVSGAPRLVGGIGVYVTDPVTGLPNVEAGEFAALSAAENAAPGFNFPIVQLTGSNAGAIFLAGILLPYVQQDSIPFGFAPNPAGTGVGGAFLVPPQNGFAAPYSENPLDSNPATTTYLVGPRQSIVPDAGVTPLTALTLADVTQITDNCVTRAKSARSLIRLRDDGSTNGNSGVPAVVIITITDVRGFILAHYRMEDSLTDAVDVVPAKARSVVYYSQANGPPVDFIPQLANGPMGIATSTTALGFLSQPFYPPGIDTTNPTRNPLDPGAGPLFALALQNQRPAQATRLGNAIDQTIDATLRGLQNGLTFFPGAVPLYKNGVLVGGLGVSGDGVEQNDLIAQAGAVGFEPPPGIRIDQFAFNNIALPYLKFIFQPGQ